HRAAADGGGTGVGVGAGEDGGASVMVDHTGAGDRGGKHISRVGVVEVQAAGARAELHLAGPNGACRCCRAARCGANIEHAGGAGIDSDIKHVVAIVDGHASTI